MIQQRIRSRGADTKETEVKTRSLLRARAGQLCESFEGRRQGKKRDGTSQGGTKKPARCRTVAFVEWLSHEMGTHGELVSNCTAHWSASLHNESDLAPKTEYFVLEKLDKVSLRGFSLLH